MLEVTPQKIEKMIYMVRGQKVMLDSDLAELYDVSTKALNQGVKRNLLRFPSSFMFQISKEEFEDLKRRFVVFREATKGRKYAPFMFSEHGVAMLSAVLSSQRAIIVSIMIVEEFIRLRSMISSEQDLSEEIDQLKDNTGKIFKVVFERLDALENRSFVLPDDRKKIGLKP